MKSIIVNSLFILIISFGNIVSQQYELESEYIIKSKSTVNIKDIKVDTKSNVIITGYYSDSVRFSDTTLFSKGGYDIYLAKFDNYNNLIWAKSYGSSENDYVTKLLLDNSDRPILVGSFNNSLFGCKDSRGAFIAKLDGIGNVMSTAFYSGDSYTFIDNVIQDYMGNLLLTGFFRGNINANLKRTDTKNYNNFFIANLDKNLKTNWQEIGSYSDELVFNNVGFVGNNFAITGQFKGFIEVSEKIESDEFRYFTILLAQSGKINKIVDSLVTVKELRKIKNGVLSNKFEEISVGANLIDSKIDNNRSIYAFNYGNKLNRVENYHVIRKYNWEDSLLSDIKLNINGSEIFFAKMDVDRNENIFLVQNTISDGINEAKILKFFNCSIRKIKMCRDVYSFKGDSVEGFKLPKDIGFYVVDNDVDKKISKRIAVEESIKHTILVEDSIGCLFRDTLRISVKPSNSIKLLKEKLDNTSNSLKKLNDKIQKSTYSLEYFNVKCSPNPLRNNAIISYMIPEKSNVNISVYSSTGNIISNLVSEKMDAGIHSISWDVPSGLISGTYIISLMLSNGENVSERVIINK